MQVFDRGEVRTRSPYAAGCRHVVPVLQEHLSPGRGQLVLVAVHLRRRLVVRDLAEHNAGQCILRDLQLYFFERGDLVEREEQTRKRRGDGRLRVVDLEYPRPVGRQRHPVRPSPVRVVQKRVARSKGRNLREFLHIDAQRAPVGGVNDVPRFCKGNVLRCCHASRFQNPLEYFKIRDKQVSELPPVRAGGKEPHHVEHDGVSALAVVAGDLPEVGRKLLQHRVIDFVVRLIHLVPGDVADLPLLQRLSGDLVGAHFRAQLVVQLVEQPPLAQDALLVLRAVQVQRIGEIPVCIDALIGFADLEVRVRRPFQPVRHLPQRALVPVRRLQELDDLIFRKIDRETGNALDAAVLHKRICPRHSAVICRPHAVGGHIGILRCQIAESLEKLSVGAVGFGVHQPVVICHVPPPPLPSLGFCVSPFSAVPFPTRNGTGQETSCSR